jgi:peroxiredoxin
MCPLFVKLLGVVVLSSELIFAQTNQLTEAQALTAITLANYKYRNNQSTKGLQQLIDKYKLQR